MIPNGIVLELEKSFDVRKGEDARIDKLRRQPLV